MIKKSLVSFMAVVSVLVGAFGFSSALPAFAYSPTLNIYSNGAGNGNVKVNISGSQPNSTVTIYYYTQTSPNRGIVAGTFGTTDYAGNFSASEPFSNDAQTGITGRYAVIGNDTTNTVNAANYGGYNGGTNGTVTFSTSNPTIATGQTSTVSIYSNNSYNYGYSSFYLSNNSNASVVSATVSGSSLQLYGLTTGSSTLMVCSNATTYGYASNCGTLYVTVNGNSSTTGVVSFAQSNVTLAVGQTNSDAIYSSANYYNTNFIISGNTNSSVVSATISGSTLQLYGITNGTATITVCPSNSYGYANTACGTVYVSVSGSNYSSGTVTAYPSNPTVAIGQTVTVTLTQSVYNSFPSNYTISTNSNPNIVSAGISGNILSLYGLSYGTSVVTVCANNSYAYNGTGCAVIPVTVGSNNTNGTVTFSNANPSITAGQQLTISLYANTAYGAASSFYIANSANTSIVSATIAGSTLQLYGNSAGSQVITVCATSSSGIANSACGTVAVTVTSGSGQVLGISTYANGQLIQEGQQISIVYRNTKSPFASYSAFTGLGFQLSNVLNVGISNLSQSSHTVITPYAAHPWGSWVKNGNTVYFVSEYGLIPVADYQVFLANGGRDAWVVAANAYDMQLPMQTIMAYGDARLK